MAVRSALLEVPGVTRAQVDLVNLKGGEAIVTFDPRVVTVDTLVTAVDKAEGPLAPRQFRAEIKEGPRPVSAR
ncbi:MAG TPA: heavy-metal-associated domain-containing protein [Vicinamibacterales bacterium]|nr:heavy-metal-associated domain-containing protein [Vicinamibacterales bacterium]